MTKLLRAEGGGGGEVGLCLVCGGAGMNLQV